MSEVRQAVATLTGYVASNSMDVPDAVLRAAGVFATACQAVNDRLATCDWLLQLHQRSEAVRQAGFEPDALAAYAELDFKGRREWVGIAVRIGAAAPPPLAAALARRLNQAFADEERVRDLLAQHRRGALARVPLRRRLDVLRLLARAEPTNVGWKDDLRRYEAARYDEIRAELAASSGPDRWRAAAALLTELNAPDWAESRPPLDLVAAAEDAAARLRRAHGEGLLRQIAAELRAAVAVLDFDKAEELAAEARAVAQEHDVHGRPVEALRPELAWIEKTREERKEERKRAAAADHLRQALDDGLDWPYVQDYYRAAIHLGPLPADLAARFAAVAARRFWLRAAAVAGGVAMLAAAAAAYAVFHFAG